jgi:hypothetical protein
MTVMNPKINLRLRLNYSTKFLTLILINNQGRGSKCWWDAAALLGVKAAILLVEVGLFPGPLRSDPGLPAAGRVLSLLSVQMAETGCLSPSLRPMEKYGFVVVVVRRRRRRLNVSCHHICTV